MAQGDVRALPESSLLCCFATAFPLIAELLLAKRASGAPWVRKI